MPVEEADFRLDTLVLVAFGKAYSKSVKMQPLWKRKYKLNISTCALA